jgi:hypothetical protein
MPERFKPTQEDEATQRILDPHRVEEQRNARQEAEFRLASRGISTAPEDADDEVADILDTVERFEQEVERQGGDLMVNRIGVAEPQDPAFVPPVRAPGEAAGSYLRRLEDAIAVLQERRRSAESAR